MEVGAKETAADLFELIISAFKNDGLEQYFKDKLYGLGTVSAIVMASRGDRTPQSGGLVAKITQYLGRDLFFAPCQAHKLSLSLKSSLKERSLHFMRCFERFLTAMTKTFSHHGHKSKYRLKEVSEAIAQRVYRIRNIYSPRWVASERNILHNVELSYNAFAEFFKKMGQQSFGRVSVKQREKATAIYELMIHPNTLMLMHWVLEVLDVMKMYSESLQAQCPTIFRFHNLQKFYLGKLASLVQQDGPRMKLFLRNVVCKQTVDEIHPFLESGVEYHAKEDSCRDITHYISSPYKVFRKQKWTKGLLLSMVLRTEEEDGFVGFGDIGFNKEMPQTSSRSRQLPDMLSANNG